VFAVAPFVTVIPGEVGSTVAAETVIVGNAVVASPVVLTADRVPVVETPVVMAGETPDMMGMVMVCPPTVVTGGVIPPPVVPPPVVPPPVVGVGGTEKMVFVEPPGLPPLSAAFGFPPAWLGNCQAANINGLRLRAKMRFLMFNMMSL
jgi:hypothetical protein